MRDSFHRHRFVLTLGLLALWHVMQYDRHLFALG
jgi:hypothetical protein